jgi:hypothetical protein
MVIRFQKPPNTRPLPLFDHLDTLEPDPDPAPEAGVLPLEGRRRRRMLSVREVEHRKKMLKHLRAVRAAQ